jgi:hyperosmotically inducible protein
MDQNVRHALPQDQLAPDPLDPPAEPAAVEKRGVSPADDLIRLAVLNALHWDLAVPWKRVRVHVRDGWVTLSGSVDRPYSKSCAERDVLTTPNVRGVTNTISVEI